MHRGGEGHGRRVKFGRGKDSTVDVFGVNESILGAVG
jgi:hypothetical protein